MNIQDATNIYLGSSAASKVMLGSTQVWPTIPFTISGRLSSEARTAGVTSVNLVFNFTNSTSYANREYMTVQVDNDGYFNVTQLDASITTPVTSLYLMFFDNNFSSGATSNDDRLLESLTFYMDTSSVTLMNQFLVQSLLTSLTITDLDLSSLTHINFVFGNCKSLATIDMTRWKIPNVTEMMGTFQQCNALTSIIWPTFTSTLQLSSIDYMFDRCSSIQTIDLRMFDLTGLSSLLYCFYKCSSLTTLYLPEIPNNISSQLKQSCFDDCSSLSDVYVYHQSTLNCITNNLSSQSSSYVPSSATIHYDDGTTQHDYVWNGSAWA